MTSVVPPEPLTIPIAPGQLVREAKWALLWFCLGLVLLVMTEVEITWISLVRIPYGREIFVGISIVLMVPFWHLLYRSRTNTPAVYADQDGVRLISEFWMSSASWAELSSIGPIEKEERHNSRVLCVTRWNGSQITVREWLIAPVTLETVSANLEQYLETFGSSSNPADPKARSWWRSVLKQRSCPLDGAPLAVLEVKLPTGALYTGPFHLCNKCGRRFHSPNGTLSEWNGLPNE